MRLIFIMAVIFFVIAYFNYGRYIKRKYRLDNKTSTPSHVMYDGVDYVPTHRVVLLGHHFSSIAGAGPIVGPIIAAMAFGWLPALIWALVGSIFIGGVHDFSALVASIRHKGRSIADIAKDYLSPRARKLFLIFVWLALIYIIIVFVDLTSVTFIQDGAVATSSVMYIVLALIFGLCLYRFKIKLLAASLIFVPLVFIAILIGQAYPIEASTIALFSLSSGKVWSIILLIYCCVASILPVWLLLQPRDYLSSYLLYACVVFGALGLIIGSWGINYPIYTSFKSSSLGWLFPMLFITVACGAISGFHSLVASGTSSKQIDKEEDAIFIGYGGMLLEGVVAVIAIATVIMLPEGSNLIKQQPLAIFASGMGNFFSSAKIDPKYGVHFGLLALSAFVLTTLDTATRIGRYVFQEFFGITGWRARFIATFSTIAIPSIMVFINFVDEAGNPIPAWKVIWPLFGSTNQLLGALALLVVFVWLSKLNISSKFILLPMVFMLIVTLFSLIFLIKKFGLTAVGVIAILLFALAIFLIFEALRVMLTFTKGGKK